MATFDRFDIVEAHCVLEWDYNTGGWLQERPSNKRRMESTAVQLHRIQFKPGLNLSYSSLSENSQEIYLTNVMKWDLPRDAEQTARIKEYFAPDWVAENYPAVFAEVFASSPL